MNDDVTVAVQDLLGMHSMLGTRHERDGAADEDG